MKGLKSFTVRSSGRLQNSYYIDCSGYYKLGDISRITGVGKEKLEELYREFGARLDDTIGVFYFPSRDQAVEALKRIETCMTAKGAGKMVFLTFEEMEYIRQTLINEGSNIINVRNELKKGIFDKFNS